MAGRAQRRTEQKAGCRVPRGEEANRMQPEDIHLLWHEQKLQKTTYTFK